MATGTVLPDVGHTHRGRECVRGIHLLNGNHSARVSGRSPRLSQGEPCSNLTDEFYFGSMQNNIINIRVFVSMLMH